VFQLNGARKWRDAMTALGFYEALEQAGFGDLGVIISSEEKRATLLRMLDELFATGSRDDWVARLRSADIVAAQSTPCSKPPTIPTCWPTDM